MPDPNHAQRWGLPDWRNASEYIPPKGRSQELEYWRWEFCRRRPDYRDAWESGDTESMKMLGYLGDPSKKSYARTAGSTVAEVLPNGKGIFIAQPYPVDTGNFLTFTFNLDRPWSEQVDAAKETFTREQENLHGKRELQPRRHMKKWSTYLRVIDARDQGVNYDEIANAILQPGSDAEVTEFDARQREDGLQQAHQTHKQAQQVMFSFPT